MVLLLHLVVAAPVFAHDRDLAIEGDVGRRRPVDLVRGIVVVDVVVDNIWRCARHPANESVSLNAWVQELAELLVVRVLTVLTIGNKYEDSNDVTLTTIAMMTKMSMLIMVIRQQHQQQQKPKQLQQQSMACLLEESVDFFQSRGGSCRKQDCISQIIVVLRHHLDEACAPPPPVLVEAVPQHRSGRLVVAVVPRVSDEAPVANTLRE